MSKSPTPSSTLFPQVSRGESNDAAKGLLDDAGDSSGDEAHYAPRGDYAPPRPVTTTPPPVTTQPSGELNQCAIVGGEEVSFVEISPDRPRLRASASSGDAPPRRPIARHSARKSIRLATPGQLRVVFRVCCVRVTERHGYLLRSKFLRVILRSPSPGRQACLVSYYANRRQTTSSRARAAARDCTLSADPRQGARHRRHQKERIQEPPNLLLPQHRLGRMDRRRRRRIPGVRRVLHPRDLLPTNFFDGGLLRI